MTQEQTYESILQRGWDEIPEPQFLPNGSYRLRCNGAKLIAPKTSDGNARVVFAMEPQEAMDDVDSHALAALGDNYDIADNMIFPTVWLGKNTDFARVRLILSKLGVDTEAFKGPQGFANSLKDAKGRECIGYIVLGSFTNKATGEVRPENQITMFSELN